MKYALTFLAGDLRVARVPLRAVAERRVLEDAAVGVAAAVARVDAVAVQARLLLRALPVRLAAHDDGGGYIEKGIFEQTSHYYRVTRPLDSCILLGVPLAW